MKCSFCIVPTTRGREVSRPFDELVEEVRAAGRRGRPRGHAARPERQLLRHPPAPAAAQVLRAAARASTRSTGIERIRYTSPHPAHMTEDVILAHAELASVCQHIHLPLQSGSSRVLKRMRRTYGRERFLDRVALIREHVPGLRADHRHHRRLPGGDRGGLRGDARGRRGGRLRRRLHLHLLAAARHRGRRVRRRLRPARGARGAHGAARRGRPAARPRARPALRRPHARRARRGHVPARPGRLRGRTTHNKVVNFDGLASPGEIVPVEIAAATSQSLTGSESLLSRAGLDLDAARAERSRLAAVASRIERNLRPARGRAGRTCR